MVIIIVMVYPGSLAAQTTVDADGARWTVANSWNFEEITGEDQGYLNVIVDGEHYRLAKDLSGALQLINNTPPTVSGSGPIISNCQTADPSYVQIKGQYLYCGEQRLLDITAYQKKNEEFCRSQPQMNQEAAEYQVCTYTNRKGSRLYLIIVSPTPAIPAPYTPYYCDLVYLPGQQASHLAAIEGLRPASLYETEDGSMWVAGIRYSGRYASENSLLRINPAGRCQSVNQVLRNNDVKWLGCQGKKALVWAATRDFYMPIGRSKYDKKADRVLWVEASGKTAQRPEKISGFTDFYCSAEDHLFGISTDRKKIADLTNKRSFSLAGEGNEYARLSQLLEKSGLGQTPTIIPRRIDTDGSTWYINSDGRIVHSVGGHEEIFNRGPQLLVTCLQNLFIDAQGRKWFISVAGIACYEKGDTEARYISLELPALVRETDKMHLVVDRQGQLWAFGDTIRRVPYQSAYAVDEIDLAGDGFKAVSQPYIEWDEQVCFAYQKENIDHSACLRVYRLGYDGKLAYSEYSLPSPPQYLYFCDRCLFLTMSDGFCRIEENQAKVYRNPALLNMQQFPYFINSHYLIFPGAARIVAVEIPVIPD